MSRRSKAKRRDDLVDHPRLKTSEIKEYREKLYEEQGFVCGLCGCTIEAEERSVLDHCHSSGHIRGTLHNGCNSLLGRIENNYKRFGVSDASLMRVSLPAYLWITGCYEDKPYHPNHRTDKEKKLHVSETAKKKRALKKARSKG